MKALITQSNYIPWKGYFDAIRAADVVVLYDDMQFTRRDWRNRNRIKTPQGTQWLTIPVEVKGKYLQKINETRISEPGWAQKHWRTLESNYKRAPFFEWVQDVIRPIYFDLDTLWLSEVNYRFLSRICQLLGIQTAFQWSSEFSLAEERTERLVNICREVGASVYLSGPSAKAYLNESVFSGHHITVQYLDFSGYPTYSQLHGAFDHQVTILDLLFHAGPQSPRFMKNLSEE